MIEIEELERWLSGLSIKQQGLFFYNAAKYFSSRELSEIVKSIQNGITIYTAHKKAGVIGRHIVELTHLKERWQEGA
ncbi:MAG: hypothetical protein JEY99_03920 [Spirochaetales bacterium]|nr:hypothetical protein [Spirochaetales bacterium]